MMVIDNTYDARHVHGVQRLSRPVLAAGFQPDRSGDRPAHAVAHNERISDIVFTDAEVESAPRQASNRASAVEVKNLTYQYDALSRPIFKDS